MTTGNGQRISKYCGIAPFLITIYIEIFPGRTFRNAWLVQALEFYSGAMIIYTNPRLLAQPKAELKEAFW